MFRTITKYGKVKRAIRFWWQRRTRGWDDSVTWNLDQQIAEWLAPKLRRFKELHNGYPHNSTPEKWNIELDEMIWSAEWYAENAYTYDCDPQEYQRAMNGLKQIMTRLHELWW